MKNKNLKLFEAVYDMILEINQKDLNESMCMAGAIIANYNWNRV